MDCTPPFQSQFVIPKKKKKEADTDGPSCSTDVPKAQLIKLDRSSAEYANYSQLVKRHFAENGELKNRIGVESIHLIANRHLEQKHEEFKQSLFRNGSTKDIFVFLAVPTMEDATRIADHGLQTSNSFYSDLGPNSEGVYVFRHPDMMIAHPFYAKRTVLGVCFKITAVKTNFVKVGLGAEQIHPTPGNLAHQAHATMERYPSRLEKYRSDQLFVYDLSSGKPSDRPATLLPQFIFELMPTRDCKPHQDFIRPEVNFYPCFAWKNRGGILANEQLVMLSTQQHLPKIKALNRELVFDEYLPLEEFHQFPPIRALFERPYCGNLLNGNLNFKMKVEKTTFYVLLTVIRSTASSGQFRRIVQILREANWALFHRKESEEVDFIALPCSETTMRLGLPYLDPKTHLYCLIVKKGHPSLMDLQEPMEKTFERELSLSRQRHDETMKCHPTYRPCCQETFEKLRNQSDESDRYVPGYTRPSYFVPYTMDADYPKRGLLKEPKPAGEMLVRFAPKKKVTWGDEVKGAALLHYSDNVAISMSRQHEEEGRSIDWSHLKSEFADKLNKKDGEESEEQRAHQQRNRNELFHAAFSKTAALDLNAELAPIFFPEDEKDAKAKKIIDNRKSVLHLPMPQSRGERDPENSPPRGVEDMEVEEAVEKGTEAEEMGGEDQPFEDPHDIDYDKMLLGAHGVMPEVAEEQPMEVEQQKSPEPEPAAASRKRPTSILSSEAINDVFKLINVPRPQEYEEEEQRAEEEEEDQPSPESPPPPESPTMEEEELPPKSKSTPMGDVEQILARIYAEREKKQVATSQDVDMRGRELLTEPKMIPLCGKVSMSLSNDKPLAKSVLPAFQQEETEEEPTKKAEDKDDRLEVKEKERPRDRDDRHRESERDRDYRRERERRDNRERERDRDRDRRDGRDRRDQDRRRDDYRSRDRDRDRGRRDSRPDERGRRRDGESKEERKSSKEEIPLPAPVPASVTDIHHQINDPIRKIQKEADIDDRLIKIPSPVPASALGLVMPIPQPVQQKADGPASPPASPDLDEPRERNRFVKNIPTMQADNPEEGEIQDDGPGTVTLVEDNARSKFETWRPNNLHAHPADPARAPPGIVLNPQFNRPPPQFPISQQMMSRPPPPFGGMVPPRIGGMGLPPMTGIPPPNIHMPPPMLAGPYGNGFAAGPPYPFPPPGLGRGFGPPPHMPRRQQHDSIIIIADDLAVRSPVTPVDKLKELLDKLHRYSQTYKMNCVFKIHESTLRIMKANAANTSHIGSSVAMNQEYLKLLDTYIALGTVHPMPHHPCDTIRNRNKETQAKCFSEIARNIRSSYQAPKIIYFTPSSSASSAGPGEIDLPQFARSLGFLWANLSDIINFDSM